MTPDQAAAVLAPCIGPVEVLQVSAKLNYKPNVDVLHLRVNAVDPSIPDTVILKTLSPNALESEVQLFTSERANHEFLIRCGFAQKPTVYGHGPTLMVLENLGLEQGGFSDTRSAEIAVASLLARLHAGSIGLERDYLNVLQGYGISEPPAKSVSRKLSFGQGWAVAAHILTEIGQDPQRFNQTIERFIQADQACDWVCGFIHDDFAHGRQAVISDTGLYIVDFERSRFGNIFVDPVRIMLGEVSAKGDDDAMLFSLDFTSEFLSIYLNQLESNLPAPLADGFEDEFGRVAILVALELIGDCVEMAESGLFVAPLEAAVADIFARLIDVLDHLSAQQDMAISLSAIVSATQNA